MILSFTSNFFSNVKFHSEEGSVIGNIKKNEVDRRDTAHQPREKHKANVHKNLITVAISHSIIHRSLITPCDLASDDATERIMK